MEDTLVGVLCLAIRLRVGDRGEIESYAMLLTDVSHGALGKVSVVIRDDVVQVAVPVD